MPFSSCEAFLEFSRTADPNSVVFSKMARSRDTITKRTQEIHQSVLCPNVVKAVNASPYWSVMADESTDSATMEFMYGILIWKGPRSLRIFLK